MRCREKTGKKVDVCENVIRCDECNKKLNWYNHINVDTKYVDYGDEFGEEWDYCSIECMMKGKKEWTEYPCDGIRLLIRKELVNEFLEFLSKSEGE